jgi:hypothetical protein
LTSSTTTTKIQTYFCYKPLTTKNKAKTTEMDTSGNSYSISKAPATIANTQPTGIINSTTLTPNRTRASIAHSNAAN